MRAYTSSGAASTQTKKSRQHIQLLRLRYMSNIMLFAWCDIALCPVFPTFSS